MQNNVTELTQKLLRALDTKYNVTDMVSVIEVITQLENISITKELLEATRLGKHINELRRNSNDGSLARRIKDLLKKWRNKVLPTPAPHSVTKSPTDTNGQLKASELHHPVQEDRKRMARGTGGNNKSKRARINGINEYDYSDNSNSSFKDTLTKNVILINSDSNSSIPDIKHEPVLEEHQPKKRGRKKGSKNHKNLLDEAETSFMSKMVVSRGNAKVKTTQELIASLQNKNSTAPTPPVASSTSSPAKNLEDWNERAAKLTERVSFIDQKLNASANRIKKKTKNNRNVLESGVVTNHHTKIEQIRPESPDEEEIVVVDEPETAPVIAPQPDSSPYMMPNMMTPSLSVEEALSRLPPIDTSCLYDYVEETCSCSIEPTASAEDEECTARDHLQHHYRLLDVDSDRIHDLHSNYRDAINGNFSTDKKADLPNSDHKIVPTFYELSPKQVDRDSVCENYKKYSISDSADAVDGEGSSNERTGMFREYHEVLDRTSYNGDVLRILPYVVID